MSARSTRRTFATPFVLTLAIPACTVSSAPPRESRPVQYGPHDETQPHRNPPPPRTAEPTPTTLPPPQTTNPPPPSGPQPPPPVMTNPPPPQPTVNPPPPQPSPTENPPSPRPPVADPSNAGVKTEPATSERRWTVSRNNGECRAAFKINCPPNALCNPPPPKKYACPPQLADDGQSITVIQRAGASECFIDTPVAKCPPKTTCNPPRPQKVACPT